MRQVRCFLPLLALLLLAGPIWAAKDSTEVSDSRQKEKKDVKVVTGFSGGMLLHVGYAFSESPDALFRNASLTGLPNFTDLPRDGVTLGLGGMLRMHLIDHIHLGVEGAVSTMPLMKSGSNIRTAWAQAICDFYFSLGLVRPLVGLGIGGGKTKRLYVPSSAEQVSGSNSLVFNASYTTTPFFMLDPYVGLEIKTGSMSALLIRVDYVLPFGKSGSIMETPKVSWSNFISPSGPRLYVGFLFGKQ